MSQVLVPVVEANWRVIVLEALQKLSECCTKVSCTTVNLGPRR